MKRVAALALASLALAACQDPASPVPSPSDPSLSRAPGDESEVIPDQYIVVFDEGADDVPGLARRLAAQANAEVRYTYQSAVKGFAGRMSAAAAAALERHPAVAYVEADQVMRASATQYMDAAGDPWGLDRINQRSLPLDKQYTYTYTGSGVRAYIIDTGLDAAHAQFEGRAQNVYDALGGNGNDCNGHGTHVGGTVGGKTYGVAKQSLVRGVRVLGCDGSGSTSGIVAAVDWVRTNRVNPAVANMSLGGGYSATLNTAVTNLANSGVFVAVAAGNENQDACNVSPASAGAAFTTAASTKTDAKASYSNYGTCVDAYAPGSAIKSAWIGSGTTETNTISGTSMASPHVAGVAALVKHRYGDVSSSSVTTYIKNAATSGVILGNVSGTPNLLLYKYVTAW
ncbi:MAG: Alkaline serine exoprotease A precursor [uncultured Gemmatimonadaceae bacterium]|uniref:Alkaline serine exoprotease A n=1 Tax=uncultured Gemmatimonadaceae bacterium TaxID=246130 RepID=A0A6J4KA34_9BACT|nr:MAG: Alkaline serine exoprotease A precursor [uncultured Gemmatimonadaceae bacterium]